MSTLKQLEKMLFQGKISRRDFLARLSAIGLSATMYNLLPGRLTHAATPKRGGTLRIGCGGGSTSDSLNPATYDDAMAMLIGFGQLNNCLVEVDHNGNAVPELAESWESTPDAAQWIFKLRKNVEFHNGKTMDAEDVIFSINHHRGKDSKSGAKVIVDPIQELKSDGKNTVIIKLEAGNADFPFLMSDFHLVILPAGTTDFEEGIGTGAYMLESFNPGVRCLCKRNPNYWKEGRAHFDEVETIAIGDVQSRTNALRTGSVDYINRVDRKTAHLIEDSKDLELVVTSGTLHYTMPMMTDVPPYDNNEVRLALKYAVNREELVDKILRGYGSVGNDHPIASFQRYFASELPQREYDPDKARFYIKKAGLEGHTFKLHAADQAFAGAVDAAVLFKEHAAKAGINMEVVHEPNDGYWSNVWMKKSWVTGYWSGRATEDWVFSTTYAEKAAWNDTHWKNEKFNKLLIAARAELDEKKRGEMYFEMQRLVRDEGGMIIPMFASHVEAANPKLKSDKVAGNWEFDGMKVAERWWFES
jgi:peptide/nickel transport system substrate-binding protein